MNSGGYFLIWRGALEHPAFQDAFEESVFMWMIGKAAWKPTRVRYRGRVIHLKRGQLAISQRDLVAGFHWSKGGAHRWLNRLKAEAMIGVDSGAGVMVITLCNYDQYQAIPGFVGAPSGADVGAQAGHRRGTEQLKELKESKGGHAVLADDKPTKRTLIDPNFQPTPVADLPPKAKALAIQWPPGAYEAEREEFISFWQSEGKTKADWQATWRNNISKVNHRVMLRAKLQAGQRPGERPYHQLVAEGRA